jgi:hypothetical protein
LTALYKRGRSKKVGVPLAGVAANVKIGANTITWMNTWQLTAKANVKETTAFQSASGYATKSATTKEWSVKIDGPLDATDTTGQVALINGLGNTFSLELDTDAAGTHKWTGSAILIGVDPKSDAKDVNQVSFAFDGTGVLTFA